MACEPAGTRRQPEAREQSRRSSQMSGDERGLGEQLREPDEPIGWMPSRGRVTLERGRARFEDLRARNRAIDVGTDATNATTALPGRCSVVPFRCVCSSSSCPSCSSPLGSPVLPGAAWASNPWPTKPESPGHWQPKSIRPSSRERPRPGWRSRVVSSALPPLDAHSRGRSYCRVPSRGVSRANRRSQVGWSASWSASPWFRRSSTGSEPEAALPWHRSALRRPLVHLVSRTAARDA